MYLKKSITRICDSLPNVWALVPCDLWSFCNSFWEVRVNTFQCMVPSCRKCQRATKTRKKCKPVVWMQFVLRNIVRVLVDGQVRTVKIQRSKNLGRRHEVRFRLLILCAELKITTHWFRSFSLSANFLQESVFRFLAWIKKICPSSMQDFSAKNIHTLPEDSSCGVFAALKLRKANWHGRHTNARQTMTTEFIFFEVVYQSRLNQWSACLSVFHLQLFFVREMSHGITTRNRIFLSEQLFCRDKSRVIVVGDTVTLAAVGKRTLTQTLLNSMDWECNFRGNELITSVSVRPSGGPLLNLAPLPGTVRVS